MPHSSGIPVQDPPKAGGKQLPEVLKFPGPLKGPIYLALHPPLDMHVYRQSFSVRVVSGLGVVVILVHSGDLLQSKHSGGVPLQTPPKALE